MNFIKFPRFFSCLQYRSSIVSLWVSQSAFVRLRLAPADMMNVEHRSGRTSLCGINWVVTNLRVLLWSEGNPVFWELGERLSPAGDKARFKYRQLSVWIVLPHQVLVTANNNGACHILRWNSCRCFYWPNKWGGQVLACEANATQAQDLPGAYVGPGVWLIDRYIAQIRVR